MSPNRAVSYNGGGGTTQKLDSLRKFGSGEYPQDYPNTPYNANTSMSFVTLNNSSEKQLGYSKSNVSFRQVSFKEYDTRSL